MPHPKGGYRVNGKRVPGVTTITGRFDDKQGLMDWYMRCGVQGVDPKRAARRAADAGTLAHDAAECYLRGESFEWDDLYAKLDIPPDAEQKEWARQSTSAAYIWVKKNKPEVVEIEGEYVDDELMYGGCFDAVVRIDGKTEMIDWKTSKSITKYNFVQLAAYMNMWEKEHGEKIDGGRIIHLCKRTGIPKDPRLSREELQPMFEEFAAMRKLYDAKRTNGTLYYAKL